jgi:hypothetical protein
MSAKHGGYETADPLNNGETKMPELRHRHVLTADDILAAVVLNVAETGPTHYSSNRDPGCAAPPANAD